MEPTLGIKWKQNPNKILGEKLNIFIKNSKGENILNAATAGTSVYYDFLNPNITTFWKESLDGLKKQLNFDGLWHDMNEIYGAYAGQVDEETGEKQLSCEDTEIYPYIPGFDESKTYEKHRGLMTEQFVQIPNTITITRTFRFITFILFSKPKFHTNTYKKKIKRNTLSFCQEQMGLDRENTQRTGRVIIIPAMIG
jgi:alpha-glucosidase (family GH31 glycosyl hydrolase)